ncbi:hypothetical protein J5226_02740 [Lysobacter sp. K5869]|uniref:hypothetical protein n=1 Tax=Lysobacter sp. K5869 TaxID=2820808 RepID=UPI001C0609F1|nr:hypothetical protein [Lysobacter sp. K5869]QWP77340.1 hypothetical protein J5226_02740 [Lysobacter sp. K5869]
MQTFNPYEAPQSAFADTSTESDDRHGPWRDGADLIALRDSHLPGRCVKCNAPGKTRLKKIYYWHSAWWLLLILFNLLVYALAAMIVRKKCRLEASLCERHARHRSRLIAAALACLGGFALALGLGIANDSGPLLLAAGLMMLVGIVVGVIAGRTLYPKRITERYARFGGGGREFLATLPAFREPGI